MHFRCCSLGKMMPKIGNGMLKDTVSRCGRCRDLHTESLPSWLHRRIFLMPIEILGQHQVLNPDVLSFSPPPRLRNPHGAKERDINP